MLGLVVLSVYVGLDRFFMWFFRIHYEGLLNPGLFWGLSLILMGIVYWIRWKGLGRILAVSFIVLANLGFLAAVSILLSTPPKYPIYYDYLHGVRDILLIPYLTVNVTGICYLLRVKPEMPAKEIAG